ncbi:hypothetical protein BBJ28_00023880, partial [Nothophytophthora sp. Chile5]
MGIFSPDTITDFVRRGDLDGVRQRLEYGDTVEERRSFQSTPLLEAARYNYVEIIELLLDHGADIEARNYSDFTALHQAIDLKKSEAAIALARRGACADEIGYLGRTPLQSAIKRDLPSVVTQLLACGANVAAPGRDGRTASDFIQTGPNQETFVTLLAMFSSMEKALAARYVDAIAVFLQRALVGGNPAEMLSLYQLVKPELLDESKGDLFGSYAHLARSYEVNMLAKVLQSGSATDLRALIEAVEDTEWVQNVTFESGSTPLYDVVCRGNLEQLEYLLVDCGVDPRVLKTDGKPAKDALNDSNVDDKMRWTVTQHIKKRTFSEAAAHILAKETAMVMELRQLLGQLTSVYDLRLLF